MATRNASNIHEYKRNAINNLGLNVQGLLKELNKSSITTTHNHTIYLFLNTHGKLVSYKQNEFEKAVIPRGINHVSYVLHGKPNCVNCVFFREPRKQLAGQLTKGLFSVSDTNRSSPTNYITEQSEKLNNGISTNDFFRVYQQVFVPLQVCHDQNAERTGLLETQQLNIPLHKSILSTTHNNYDLFNYVIGGDGKLLFKKHHYDTLDIHQTGIICLYASGGIFREKILHNIMGSLGRSFKRSHNGKPYEIFDTDTNNILQKLNAHGYTQIYILDDSCNVSDYGHVLNTNEKVKAFHNSINRQRNNRIKHSSYGNSPTRRNNTTQSMKKASANSPALHVLSRKSRLNKNERNRQIAMLSNMFGIPPPPPKVQLAELQPPPPPNNERAELQFNLIGQKNNQLSELQLLPPPMNGFPISPPPMNGFPRSP
jgi:hypothetical protein